MIQQRLSEGIKQKSVYDYPQVNYLSGSLQRIETHRGCPNKCPYCYEPDINVTFPIPKIERNQVQILDMNFLVQSTIVSRIRELSEQKVNKRVVYYEAVCGFDYRYLTQEIANELKVARFKRIRLAWDYGYREQLKIKDAVAKMLKAGFKREDLMIFMIVNWKIPKWECERKLDLLKVWNLKVCDCCFDGGHKHAIPFHWTEREIQEFRWKSRKHNQLVNFKMDPQIGGEYGKTLSA